MADDTGPGKEPAAAPDAGAGTAGAAIPDAGAGTAGAAIPDAGAGAAGAAAAALDAPWSAEKCQQEGQSMRERLQAALRLTGEMQCHPPADDSGEWHWRIKLTPISGWLSLGQPPVRMLDTLEKEASEVGVAGLDFASAKRVAAELPMPPRKAGGREGPRGTRPTASDAGDSSKKKGSTPRRAPASAQLHDMAQLHDQLQAMSPQTDAVSALVTRLVNAIATLQRNAQDAVTKAAEDMRVLGADNKKALFARYMQDRESELEARHRAAQERRARAEARLCEIEARQREVERQLHDAATAPPRAAADDAGAEGEGHPAKRGRGGRGRKGRRGAK